jgi:hypothetical protein
MTIDDIEEKELTAGERGVLAEDRERWKRMGVGAHLDDWLAYGAGLMLRRRLAMRIAFVNRPEGKGYARAFGQLMKHDGLDGMDKTSISAVLWLNDDPERMVILREIRESMSVGERARLNSPISARQRVEKILKARHGGTEEGMRTSPVVALKRQLAEKGREITDLHERLAAAERRDADGSLFDLKQDVAQDIGRIIVATVGQHKARGISDAIREGLGEKRRERKPAG